MTAGGFVEGPHALVFVTLLVHVTPSFWEHVDTKTLEDVAAGVVSDARFEKCTEECGPGNPYVPTGLYYDCKAVSALRDRIATIEPRPLLKYGPERADGVGARAYARVCVMVLAEALGFRYVHSPFDGGVRTKTFGPTDMKGPIDWESFLNMGASGAVGPKDVTFAEIDFVHKLLDEQKKMGNAWVPKKAYMIPHGYTLTDHPCWHKHLWKAFAKVGRQLSNNYQQADIKRPECKYNKQNNINVAVHMRRGDVMKGDPSELTRCGKPIFPNGLPSNHPRWKSYFMEDFHRRSHDFAYYMKILKTVIKQAKELGKSVTIYIYSQTSKYETCKTSYLEDFPEFDFPKEKYGKAIDTIVSTKGEASPEFSKVHMILNNHPSDCFHCLVEADVLLVARSSFSMLAGLMSRPEQVKIYPLHETTLTQSDYEHFKPGEDWIDANENDGTILDAARLKEALRMVSDNSLEGKKKKIPKFVQHGIRGKK